MTDDPSFSRLLDFVRDHRGFDFTGYKTNTLSRRIDKRMGEVGVEGYADYVEYLEVHPDEFPRLFNTILINVTSLFRDPESWDHLQNVVLPEILAARAADEPIRVWSAGCASGQEAYTLAIVLSELLGPEAFMERVKIYATDVDEEALLEARAGVFASRETEELASALVERYFEEVGTQHRFRGDLRRNLIFGRHDITSDAPISNLDLLVCRNTMMYFNAETQARVLPRFHYALREDAALFLGRAEMLLTHSDMFEPIEITHRLFHRIGTGQQKTSPKTRAARPTPPDGAELQELAFHGGGAAEIVVDAASTLVAANGQARSTFGIGDADLGTPLRELEVSYRPIELRARIDQVLNEKRPVKVRNIERTFPEGDPQFLDLVLTPLGPAADPRGVSIAFVDVTRFTLLQLDVKRSNEQLEGAYEQLQSTNEELETTNEELQSTIEERETTNEELQSTNEELETMNEELQSTNEELETMNVELRVRSEDVEHSRRLLDALLDTLTDPVIAVDARRDVILWTRAAAELWGLTSEEVLGRPLAALDFGLPVNDLDAALTGFSAGSENRTTVTLPAVSRRGRAFDASVTIHRLAGDQIAGGLVVVTSGHDAEPGESSPIER